MFSPQIEVQGCCREPHDLLQEMTLAVAAAEAAVETLVDSTKNVSYSIRCFPSIAHTYEQMAHRDRNLALIPSKHEAMSYLIM